MITPLLSSLAYVFPPLAHLGNHAQHGAQDTTEVGAGIVQHVLSSPIHFLPALLILAAGLLIGRARIRAK